jgi:hypothetical protein
MTFVRIQIQIFKLAGSYPEPIAHQNVLPPNYIEILFLKKGLKTYTLSIPKNKERQKYCTLILVASDPDPQHCRYIERGGAASRNTWVTEKSVIHIFGKWNGLLTVYSIIKMWTGTTVLTSQFVFTSICSLEYIFGLQCPRYSICFLQRYMCRSVLKHTVYCFSGGVAGMCAVLSGKYSRYLQYCIF